MSAITLDQALRHLAECQKDTFSMCECNNYGDKESWWHLYINAVDLGDIADFTQDDIDSIAARIGGGYIVHVVIVPTARTGIIELRGCFSKYGYWDAGIDVYSIECNVVDYTERVKEVKIETTIRAIIAEYGEPT